MPLSPFYVLSVGMAAFTVSSGMISLVKFARHRLEGVDVIRSSMCYPAPGFPP